MRIHEIDITWPDNRIYYVCEHKKKMYTLSRKGKSYELLDAGGEIIENEPVKRELINYCAHLSTKAIESGLKH